MLRRERVFRKVSIGTATVVMTVGLMATFSHEANATGGGESGNLKAVLILCYHQGENGYSYSNDCESGAQGCVDTTCD